jgi:hypothetical protein
MSRLTKRPQVPKAEALAPEIADAAREALHLHK